MMGSLSLHPTTSRPKFVGHNPLPQLLQTPSGLALLELQGTINLPEQDETLDGDSKTGVKETEIGRLIFPDYDPQDSSSTTWMKRVYMYVGKHQRLTGEVKKLPKAIAVIRRRTEGLSQNNTSITALVEVSEQPEELEIVEIVKYKILFSLRPEPVGTWAAEE
ncbi:chromosome transmission fidelity protein 8 [Tricladium varicosporioides]|nr:chromosome transmission fidelity protein 8 [Hymenoscyphus varicosporioides]